MNLANPGELRRFLSKHGIQAEKSLGQHFLCSAPVVKAIVDRTEAMAGILEIGPGPGILTSELAAWDRKLIALELDPRMIPALVESAPFADVRNLDAIKADFSLLLAELPPPRGIVGNLPYYITGALVNQIADAWAHFDLAVVMMQKEVADRISARPLDSNRGSLSVYLQAIFDIEVVVQVPPEAFLPAPSVKSTVLQLKPRRRERPISNEVFRVIKQGFSQPRKTLSNNLVAGLGLDRETVGRAIEEARLRGDVRAHMLTEENWISVAEGLV